jgi:hypothetical protein
MNWGGGCHIALHAANNMNHEGERTSTKSRGHDSK